MARSGVPLVCMWVLTVSSGKSAARTVQPATAPAMAETTMGSSVVVGVGGDVVGAVSALSHARDGEAAIASTWF